MDSYKKINIPENIDRYSGLISQLSCAQEEIKKYDYIGIKIATGVATIEDYSEEIEYMESIRIVIREIEEELKELEEAQNEETEELSE